MNAPDSPGTVVYRLDSLQKAIEVERADRRRDVEKLDVEKADAKDVARLASEFKSLRLTLQWFMGVCATAAVAVIVLILQNAGG